MSISFIIFLVYTLNLLYICKTRIDAQPLIDLQSLNPCPISTSRTSVYLRSMSFFKFSNLWLFLTFSNRHPMTSLAYTLTLANKSTIDLKIWKGCWFENALQIIVIWDNDVSGCRFEQWTLIWVWMLIWYHIYRSAIVVVIVW